MDALRSHPRLWSRIAPNNTFDTRACKLIVNALPGGETISTGKQCIDFLVANLDAALQSLYPTPAPLSENQCDSTIEAEAIERMLTCVHACYKTDRGIIMLENEFLLFRDVPEDERETWYTETCEAWKNRLHSALQEEFCSALRLWFLAQLS
jgi:hypothetical protein